MLKITRAANGEVVFTLSGRMDEENVGGMKTLFGSEAKGRRIVLDLKDLTLVDREAVRFLDSCETDSIKIRNAQHTFASGSRGNEREIEIDVVSKLFLDDDSEGDAMATATQWGHVKVLDTAKRSSASCHFEDALRHKIVGQEEAVQALADIYQVFCAGLHSPAHPIGNLLFLGPTGSGKTRIVEAAAEIFCSEDSRAMPQSGLRGVSALARDRQIDWVTAGLLGPSRNAPTDHSGSAGQEPYRTPEAKFPVV